VGWEIVCRNDTVPFPFLSFFFFFEVYGSVMKIFAEEDTLGGSSVE
jgi:hypothetical protein